MNKFKISSLEDVMNLFRVGIITLEEARDMIELDFENKPTWLDKTIWYGNAKGIYKRDGVNWKEVVKFSE